MTNGEQTTESNTVTSTSISTSASTPTADPAPREKNRDTGSEASAAAKSTLEKEIDDLRFEVERSIRYNSRRRAFYEWWHRFTMFVVIAAGSSAFAELFGWKLVFEGIIVLAGTLDLVIGFSMKARDHQQLGRRFYELAIVMDTTAQPNQKDLATWTKKRLEIDADEPPVYCALEADCWNEAARAMGRDDENEESRRLNIIPRRFRWTKNLCRWSGHDFRPKPRT